MKRLLLATTGIELGAGLALLTFPSATVALILGLPLTTAATVALGRLAGAAVLTLGLGAGLAWRDGQGGAARVVVGAMTVYNLGAAIILGVAGMQSNPSGAALWPAVALHAAMALWCIISLRRVESVPQQPNQSPT